MFYVLKLWFAFMIGLLSISLYSCDSDESDPSEACTLDCHDHGQCAMIRGSEQCICDTGYAGEQCDQCEQGYVLSEDGLCLDDPCLPNPCTDPLQNRCEVQNGEAICQCSEGSQDNDGDGLCAPTCESDLGRHEVRDCDDHSGYPLWQGSRSCDIAIRYTPALGESIQTLYVRGEFNGWNADEPMTLKENGCFETVLHLSPGSYGYKFYQSQGDRWFEDPNNPYFKWVDGQRNSRLIVPDCQEPLLRLADAPKVRGDQVQIVVQYVDGASEAGIDGQIEVTRNGKPLAEAHWTWHEEDHYVVVKDRNLAEGKYSYRFRARDRNGPQSNLVYVPVWVESTPFDWRDSILYFAMTDRFANGDPSNDQPLSDVDPKANWQGGDFKGLKEKIESGYFEQLGVNVLWISSIVQNTGRSGYGSDQILYSAYHSYWPMGTGWTEEHQWLGVEPTDPHFGTLEAFKDLVQTAHRHHIRILVDFVANHVHEDSPMWTHHSNDGWFHTPAEVCQDIDWSQPITCWFASYLPDLNYQNDEVMDLVLDHALWLITETDIDGFRLDAVKHMIDDFSYGIRGRIREALPYSHFYMVGETFTGEDGTALLQHYIGSKMLDGQFDFPLYWQILEVFLREERDLKALESMVAWNDEAYGDQALMSTFLGNHDLCRAISHANGDIGDMWCNGGKAQGWQNPPQVPVQPLPYQKLKLAWTFLMSSPGIPLIYYGDEFGMPGAGDPDNRRFMKFDSELTELQRETLNFVQELGRIRHAHLALSRGQRSTVRMDDDGLFWAYEMRFEEDRVLVILNRSDQTRTMDLSAWPPLKNEYTQKIQGQEIAVSGHESAILSLVQTSLE